MDHGTVRLDVNILSRSRPLPIRALLCVPLGMDIGVLGNIIRKDLLVFISVLVFDLAD